MKLNKPSCNICKALQKAIEAYIAKVDNDLENSMDDAGYVDSEDSVNAASDLEEDVAEILTEQTEELADVIEEAGTIPKAKKAVEEYFEDDVTGEILSATFRDYFSETILSLSDSYMKEVEGDMAVTQLRARTTAWVNQWSNELANLMQLTSADKMKSLLQEAIDSDKGAVVFARNLIDEGIRQEAYRARTVAVTEMLRAHSVAQQEAIMQSPATDRKKWRHSGAHKNEPRPNHVAMDGQIVPKADPFVLTGRDGGTYYPMYPRDTELPPFESINCHCIHVPVTNDDVLGMSYEERKKMQEDFIAADDGEWEKTLDARNKLLSENPIKIDGVKEVSKEYILRSTPGKGSLNKEPNYYDKKHNEEIDFSNWLYGKLGGDIILKSDSQITNVHMADYSWNGKLWELKTLETNKYNTVDQQIRKAYHQIESNKGGVFLDMSKSELSINETAEMATRSVRNRTDGEVLDVLIRKNDSFAIIRIE